LLAASLAALALSNPIVIHNPRADRIVILLDLSPSARTSPWQSPAWVRSLAQARLAPKTRITVVSFGGKSAPRLQLEDLPLTAAEARWPLTWNAPESGEGSDLAVALAFRTPAEARNEIPLAPRWIITDGLLDNAAQPPSPLAFTPVPPAAPDFAVTDLVIRNVDQSAEILAQITATAAGQLTLEIARDNTTLSRQPITFTAAGTRWITLRDPAAGNTSHRYDITLTTHDPWPENDHAAALYQPDNAPPKVLTLTNNAANFPADLQSLLADGTQVILLDDLPLDALPPNAPQLLDNFVRDTGGGLLILGRQHAFGPGRYAESQTLDTLSPLASQQENRPAAHIVFLLDASGSMNESAPTGEGGGQKFRLALHGAQQALTLLHDNDRVSILAFNDKTTLLADTSRNQLKPFDTVHPTGNTIPDSALPELTRLLTMPPAAQQPPLKMLVLLTDGEIPKLDIAAWKKLLANTKTALTIVAPPPIPGSPLAALAPQAGASWLRTTDPAQWSTLLKRALAEKLTGKALTTPLPWRTSAPPHLTGTATQWIETWKHPDAIERAIAQDNPQQVLAAVAQRGLGKVAAIAFNAAQSSSGQQLPRSLLRDITPPPGDRRFTLTARRDADAWRITADAIDAGKFLDNQPLRLRLLNATRQTLPVPQVAPGRYELRIPAAAPFAAIVVRPTDTGEQLVGRIQPPHLVLGEYPASYNHAPVAPQNIAPISADPNVHERWSPRVLHIAKPLAPFLWIASILAALGALWLRRGPLKMIKS
jgi:hypothetical protein